MKTEITLTKSEVLTLLGKGSIEIKGVTVTIAPTAMDYLDKARKLLLDNSGDIETTV